MMTEVGQPVDRSIDSKHDSPVEATVSNAATGVKMQNDDHVSLAWAGAVVACHADGGD